MWRDVPLMSIPEAAKKLGVAKRGLRRAAEQHGLLVRIGRKPMINPNSLPELIEKCRENPRVHASTGTKSAGSSMSATADDSLERAQATAEKLKRPSRATSRNVAGQLVHLHPAE